jgi:two-component system sensor histidine kinase PilS (NtrC family)
LSNITTTDNRAASAQAWTPSRVYGAYRLLLAIILVFAFMLTRPAPLVGQFLPELFGFSASAYLLFAIIAPMMERLIQRRQSAIWRFIPLSVDVAFLTIFIHASGGIGGNLTPLLLVTVAAGNIMLPGRMGLLVAALATLAVIFEQFYYTLQFSYANPFELTQSGLLGLSFFVISIITQQITRRLAHSEALTTLQREEIDRLEELNRQIVQRMRTGIMVFDDQQNILMANRSARVLFDSPMEGRRLPEALSDSYRRWLSNPARSGESLTLSREAQRLNVGFARLSDTENNGMTIAFLEDHARVVQEAQQLKLASLGRMSATIAHEIRNPLSAIRHAAGLLAEGEQNEQDQRLLGIIESHVNRVNAIIGDVLNISRRPTGNVERRSLPALLEEIREDWIHRGKSAEQLILARSDLEVEIRFDMQQFRQVLDNLIDNAFLHGGDDVSITLEYGLHPGTRLPWLRILDDGPGVPDDNISNLFEPFFTSTKQGTGLGLFVCRELCESNQARLDYEPGHGGACFVITFAHPDRVFE